MVPVWLKRSTTVLSVLLGFATWLLVVPAWTLSSRNGPADRIISALFAPGYRLGRFIGQRVFPDYLTHGTNGWYLVPLLSAGGEILSLALLYFIGISSWKKFQPADATPSHAPQPRRHPLPDKHFDGSAEADYIPSFEGGTSPDGLALARQTLGYERFKLANWRRFHEHTGRWPVLSMLFHYTCIAVLLAGMAVFFWIGNDREWSTLHWFVVGASAGVLFITVFFAGEWATRQLDWKLFGNSRN